MLDTDPDCDQLFEGNLLDDFYQTDLNLSKMLVYMALFNSVPNPVQMQVETE